MPVSNFVSVQSGITKKTIFFVLLLNRFCLFQDFKSIYFKAALLNRLTYCFMLLTSTFQPLKTNNLFDITRY